MMPIIWIRVEAMINDFWRTYNSEESFLPLYLPLIIWVTSLAYSNYKGFAFHKWYLLHNFHNLVAILLGSISIYYNDDFIFNERIPILFSSGYFFIDMLECAYRGDGIYLLHAVFCFLLGYANYATPLCRALRMNSKATYCELSNPFMHWAKSARNAPTMALFTAVFTACRIVWLPIMMKQMATAGLPWNDVRMVGVLAFYGLNLFWYYKILRILVRGVLGLSDGEEERPKKKEA